MEIIGDSAFYGCGSLISVIIGNRVTSIGQQAFDYCDKLIEVYNKSFLSISKGSSSYGRVGYYAKNIYTLTSGASKLMNDSGYIIYVDGSEKILVGYTGGETDLILPSYITQIYPRAFYNCSSLKSVIISEGVTSIDTLAFYYCINLTSVVIPDSVTSIGSYAFYVCDNLTRVYYKGTSEEWIKISIDSDNSYLTNVVRYYYSENHPTQTGNYWHYDSNGEIVIW